MVRDLGRELFWAGCFILASLAYYVARAIAAPLDVSIFGTRPFHFIAAEIESAIVEPLDDLRKSLEAEVTKGFYDLVDDLLIVIALPVLLALGIKKALEYLWNAALRPLIHSITDTIETTASHALARVESLATTVVNNLTRAESYARGQAAGALADAKSWARTEIDAARSAAIAYADEAVAKLRAAEDAAVAGAVKLANEARTAGEAAAATVLRTAEREISTVASEAETLAARAAAEAEAVSARALAEADAVFTAAVADVRAIAIGAEHDLTDFEDYVRSLGLPGLIAGSAAIATVVTLVLTETGLENQACRSKVKQICGTDPRAWETLLLGIVAVGFAFNLADVVKAAGALVDEISPLLAELGSVAAGAIDDAGAAIGELALKIAA